MVKRTSTPHFSAVLVSFVKLKTRLIATCAVMSSQVGAASNALLHASTFATEPSIFHVGVMRIFVARASVSSGFANWNLMTVSFLEKFQTLTLVAKLPSTASTRS